MSVIVEDTTTTEASEKISQKQAWMPRVCRVDAIDASGVLFAVASGTENFRVNQFGGEREFTQAIIESVSMNEVLYDIGTCIGFVTVHAAKRGAKVIGFEPDAQLRARTQHNLTLNQLEATVLNVAIADTDGEITLYTDGGHGTSPALFNTDGRGTARVPMRSIDSLLAAREIPAPHVIKLDIEGAEVRALRGMSRLLSSDVRPRKLYIEVHPSFITQLNDDPGDVEKILVNAGYILRDRQQRYAQLHEIWEAA
jgi:FkbM family methyltransferase